MFRSSVLLLIVLCLLIGADYLSAWTAPAAMPPASNVTAPLNTGTANQLKSAGLSLNTLLVTGASMIGLDLTPEANLLLDVNGRVGATEYCDNNGLNCVSVLGGGGGSVSLTGGPGITLSPVTITGAGTISANTTYLQRRIMGVCPVGQAIRSINADGTVVCQASSATCLWKGLTYSQGATCRTTQVSCNTTGFGSGATYYHQTCGANGQWINGNGPACTSSGSGYAACP